MGSGAWSTSKCYALVPWEASHNSTNVFTRNSDSNCRLCKPVTLLLDITLLFYVKTFLSPGHYVRTSLECVVLEYLRTLHGG